MPSALALPTEEPTPFILCCFLPPWYKIMAGGPESIHLPETNSSLGTGPTFVSFRKSSTQKTGDLYEHDLGPL